MTDELVRRNYSEGTARAYLRSVASFAEYFKRPPDQLGPEQIREYVAHLFEVRQLSSCSVSQHVAALRFFYVKTFRQAWSVEETPYPKKEKRLVCSQKAMPPYYQWLAIFKCGECWDRFTHGKT
jgi:site-specific recombinase XerD